MDKDQPTPDEDQPTPMDDLADKPSQAEGAPGDDDITAEDAE